MISLMELVMACYLGLLSPLIIQVGRRLDGVLGESSSWGLALSIWAALRRACKESGALSREIVPRFFSVSCKGFQILLLRPA